MYHLSEKGIVIKIINNLTGVVRFTRGHRRMFSNKRVKNYSACYFTTAPPNSMPRGWGDSGFGSASTPEVFSAQTGRQSRPLIKYNLTKAEESVALTGILYSGVDVTVISASRLAVSSGNSSAFRGWWSCCNVSKQRSHPCKGPRKLGSKYSSIYIGNTYYIMGS